MMLVIIACGIFAGSLVLMALLDLLERALPRRVIYAAFVTVLIPLWVLREKLSEFWILLIVPAVLLTVVFRFFAAQSAKADAVQEKLESLERQIEQLKKE